MSITLSIVLATQLVWALLQIYYYGVVQIRNVDYFIFAILYFFVYKFVNERVVFCELHKVKITKKNNKDNYTDDNAE